MGASEPKIDVEKGNTTDTVEVKGNYYQIHGDFINSSNLSDPPPKQSKSRTTIIFEIEGCLDEIDPIQLKELLKVLRQVSGDGSVMMRDIEKGSIKITLEASEQGIEKLLEEFQTNQLNRINDFNIINTRILSEKERIELKLKLIQSLYYLRPITERLRWADLSGADLKWSDLRKVNLKGVDFRGADLKWADLRGADLREADLRGADLRGADLRGLNLKQVDLRGADLSGSDLRYADLRQTNLSEVDLKETDLRQTNLSGVNLSDYVLRGANLRGATLRRTDFRGADLEEADLSCSDLRQADMRQADLYRTDFVNSDLEGAVFESNWGMSNNMKANFIRRGAIFRDPQSSDEQVLLPS